MKSLRSLLLMISLAPLIIVFLISATNLNNKSKLNIFIWKTPELHFGTYLALGVSLGFISAFSTSISFVSNRRLKSTKRYIFNKGSDKDFDEYKLRELSSSSNNKDNDNPLYTEEKYIERDLRDTYPTVTVPYKVRKKGNSTIRSSSRQREPFDNQDVITNKNINIKESQNQYKQDDDWSNNDYENW